MTGEQLPLFTDAETCIRDAAQRWGISWITLHDRGIDGCPWPVWTSFREVKSGGGLGAIPR